MTLNMATSKQSSLIGFLSSFWKKLLAGSASHQYKDQFESLSDLEKKAEFKKIIVTYTKQFEQSKIMEKIIEK